MNIIRIFLKELKQVIRDKKANAIMVLFPIVLILILSTAFSGSFNDSIDFDDFNVLYTSNASKALEESFTEFTSGIKDELGIIFTKIDDKAKGMESVKEGNFACYIILTGSPDGIEIYKNDRYDFKANLIESMCKTFSQRYDAISEVGKSNPALIEEILKDTKMNYTSVKSFDKKNAPSSLDYYAVTMLTLILLYASMTGYSSIKSEKNLKTQSRIFASPVRKHEYLIGKIAGTISVSFLQALVIFVFGKYILHANWGNDILTILLIVISECIMTISIGAGVATMFKNEGAGAGIINIVIPIIAFLGGGYVPLSNLGKGVQSIANVSPLKWTNETIFRIIYDSDYSTVVNALLINLFISALFIIIASIKTRKEAI